MNDWFEMMAVAHVFQDRVRENLTNVENETDRQVLLQWAAWTTKQCYKQNALQVQNAELSTNFKTVDKAIQKEHGLILEAKEEIEAEKRLQIELEKLLDEQQKKNDLFCEASKFLETCDTFRNRKSSSTATG
jgi:hypothetical protein